MLNLRILTVVFTLAILTLLPLRLLSQVSMAPESMGSGGGGTAYLTGYEALFVNPANLYIREKNYSFQIALLQGSGYMDTQLAIYDPINRFKRYTKTLQPYMAVHSNRMITDEDREIIINRMFRNGRSSGEMQSQTEIYWFGMKWVKEKRSHALALRTRTGSRSVIGRGYFTREPEQIDGSPAVNHSFLNQSQSLHELSYGYAESFTFLNGLSPKLSEFIVGVAPKIVVSGSYIKTQHDNFYWLNTENSEWLQHSGFYQQASGAFSQTADAFYRSSGDPDALTASRPTLADLLQPAGIGLGLDVGLTYLITFGNDLSLLRREESTTKKSLRISLSATDLGIIFHKKNGVEYRSEESVQEVDQPEPVSEMEFGNAPNEYLFFLGQHSQHPLAAAETRQHTRFNSMLPTTLNLGALLQIDRIKIMGDISYTVADNAFNRNRITTFIGAELRPFPFLPLRAGTRFTSNLPGYYSFGTGIETRYFDLNAAIQLRSRSIGPTAEIAAASFVGFRFYIP